MLHTKQGKQYKVEANKGVPKHILINLVETKVPQRDPSQVYSFNEGKGMFSIEARAKMK